MLQINLRNLTVLKADYWHTRGTFVTLQLVWFLDRNSNLAEL